MMIFKDIPKESVRGLDISMEAAPARQTAIDTARMALAPRLDWPADLLGVCSWRECIHVNLYVCVYIYMYVCMYVGMYVRTYVRTYVCMDGCMYVCMYVYIYMYINLYVHIQMNY